jgi:hypothetical protein
VRRKDDTGRRGTDQVRRHAKITEEEGTGKTENETQQKTTAERTIGTFRNKEQSMVCCRITRREFS